MIAEGKFLGYELMTHGWGDEWNVVDYFVVAGLGSFFANFAELNRRVNEANAARPAPATPPRPFAEICTAHKDNIYAVVHPRVAGAG